MVDIAAQSPSWNGGAPTQYIQSVIDSNPSGTTYRLLAGKHRFQTIVPKVNDTIIFADGAIMTGGEDISGGWTQDGSEWYKDGITRGRTSVHGNAQCRVGYECGELNWVIVDGRPKAWVTSRGAVNADTAYYDSGNSRVYLGVNPTGLTVEIARQPRALYGAVNNVTVKAENWSFYGIVENYASDAQSQNAGFSPGRDPVNPVGSGWTLENLIIRNFSGSAYAASHGESARNVKVYHTGQLGVMAGGTDGAEMAYCHVYDNGLGGWETGWEGGNSKYADTSNHVIKGSKFILTGGFLTLDSISPLWYDINNDGYRIFDNIIADPAHEGQRSIFMEISYSGKIYRNVCYELAHAAENNGWASGIIINNTGAYPGVTIDDTVEVYENVLYNCSSGVKCYIQNRGTGSKGVWITKDLDCHHNLSVFPNDGFSGWTELTGSVDDASSYDYDESLDYDYNTYRVPSSAGDHFVDQGPGGGGITNWSGWQSAGFDVNGQIIQETTHPSSLPDPDLGGCLAAAGGF